MNDYTNSCICSLVKLPIDMTKTTPTECIGLLFQNKDGVYNIPKNIEDVEKSHQWFGNKPYHVYLVQDTINNWINHGEYVIYNDIVYKCIGYDVTQYKFECVADSSQIYVQKYDVRHKIVASTDQAITPDDKIFSDILEGVYLRNLNDDEIDAIQIKLRLDSDGFLVKNGLYICLKTIIQSPVGEYNYTKALKDTWRKHANKLNVLKYNRELMPAKIIVLIQT